MKARNENLSSIDAIMDAEFGKPGTPEREEFRKEAYAYCMGQIICDARKKEKMTQSELAEKIGTNKSYISRIEKGIVDPGISTFCRIIDALGLKIDIVKPVLLWKIIRIMPEKTFTATVHTAFTLIMPEKDLYCSITIQTVSENRKPVPSKDFPLKSSRMWTRYH